METRKIKRIKIISGVTNEELQKNLNEFYFEVESMGYVVIHTKLLSNREPIIMQIVYLVEVKDDK
jgi:hypothetical protein